MKWDQGHVVNGECLAVMDRMKPGSVDMVFADLPYGVTDCEWDTIIPFDKLWAGLERICKPNAPLIFTATQPFTSMVVMSKPKWFKHEWIWDKVMPVGFLLVKYGPMRRHESVLVFANGGGPLAAWNPVKSSLLYPKDGKIGGEKDARRGGKVYRKMKKDNPTINKRYADLNPPSILVVSRKAPSNNIHPTQKPKALLEYLIRSYSNPGDLVFDPVAGSCTTAVAAFWTDRRFYCVEQDPDMYKKACKRIDKEINTPSFGVKRP